MMRVTGSHKTMSIKRMLLGSTLLGAAVLAGLGAGAEPLGASVALGTRIDTAITRPSQEIELRLKYQGLVKEVKVEEGDVVKAGAVLIVMDSIEETFERDAMKLEADSGLTVLAAEANVTQKKLELQKVQQIHDQGGQNDLEFAKAKTDVQVAELQVAKEKQDLEVKKLKVRKQDELLTKMELRSPVDGVVQSVGTHPGEFVDPSKPPVVTVIQNNPLQVEIQLSPFEGQKLKMGRKLRVSYDSKEWRDATVYYLAPKGDASSGLQTVKLKLPNPEGTASGAQIFVEVPSDVALQKPTIGGLK